MFTCVPKEGLEYVYPRADFPKTEFIETLTGYVPEDPSLESYQLPMAERSLRIFYRGRDLPYQYGLLGREKYTIGLEVKRLADARQLSCDIAVDSMSRIYGAEWYRRLASARATLGTESGSNIFDFDGSLASLCRDFSHQPFEDIHSRFLAAHEGPVSMNQISPKIFEAIRLRTALILFEGTYSGVVQPDVHFIPLKKDYSNIADVFAKLEDIPFLEKMTALAYDDIVATKRYSYESFVGEFDEFVIRNVRKAARAKIGMLPLLHQFREQGGAFSIANWTQLTPLLTKLPLRVANERERVMADVSKYAAQYLEKQITQRTKELVEQHRVEQARLTSERDQKALERDQLLFERDQLSAKLAKPIWYHLSRRAWLGLPTRFRVLMLRKLNLD